jgi:hypothetical protein
MLPAVPHLCLAIVRYEKNSLHIGCGNHKQGKDRAPQLRPAEITKATVCSRLAENQGF